jgi:hypothetical protein
MLLTGTVEHSRVLHQRCSTYTYTNILSIPFRAFISQKLLDACIHERLDEPALKKQKGHKKRRHG